MENKDERSDGKPDLQPGSPSNRSRVIQPVTDMSEYASKPPAKAPTDHTEPPKRAIYPEVKLDASQASSAPAPPHANQEKSYLSNDLAASRVPTLRIYAILLLAEAAYSLYRLVVAHTGIGALLLAAALGTAGFNIIVALYLLKATDLRVVSGFLLALLISSGLGVLSLGVSLVQLANHLTTSIVVHFLIAAGLLAYLWYVRSQVELTSLD